MRLKEIRPVFVVHMPEVYEEGVLYISEEYNGCGHLCACGCGKKTYMRLGPGNDVWQLVKNRDGTVTLRGSIANWKGEKPKPHAHYFIENNKIRWD